ncbi:hypothetical protein L6R53_31735 [Myxococcota bacterium]|nr:hypothetical protein [Myxococcota bacterium]
MPQTDPRPTASTAAALLWGPLLTGLLVGVVADRSLVGALLLLGEPALVVAAVWLVLSLAWSGRWGRAVAALIGCVGGLAAFHLPASPSPPPVQRPAWATGLRACATDDLPLQGALRVAQWTLRDGATPEPSALEALSDGVDLVLLHGAAGPETGARVATLVEGEARFYPPGTAGEGSMTLVVRGGFAPCGDQGQDAWSVDLPAAEGHAARGVVTFPRIEGVGVFPLVAVRLDPAHGPARWAGWTTRLDQSGQRLAAVVHAIDPSRLVLIGDLASPPSFRRLAGHLRGAGLWEHPGPPTWPTRLLGLPFPALHRLDRVWAGRAWVSGGGGTQAAEPQARAAVWARLVPETMTARTRPR